MGKEELKAIFIEEANEIIEKLDADIIDFEADPSNKQLINELFRGVHTLKGNANAFGFSRLGGFVHHFEDLLDRYRSSDNPIPSNAVDVLLNGVDAIKATLSYEVDGIDGVPDGYEECLSDIVSLLDGKSVGVAPQIASAPTTAGNLHDLSQEFGNFEQNSDRLYLIELNFDKDIYFRGYDHILFFKMLSEDGEIRESYWGCEDIPALDKFVSDESMFKTVSLIYASKKSKAEIEEIFEFLFDNEYKVIEMGGDEKPKEEAKVNTPPKAAAEQTIQTPKQDIKAEESKDVVKPKKEKDAEQQPQQKSYIKIDTMKLDELFDTVGELVIAQNFIAQNDKIRALLDPNINKTIEVLSKITKLIQDRVMSLRMVAIKDTFEKMKRVARDTAKKTGKEIALNIHGEETEIDKTMIDSLSDPIVHMIRNAIDHGLEGSAEERIKAGKNPEGSITLRAFHKSGNIIIAISDDGKGIDKDVVLQKGIEKGLVNEGEQLTDQQIYGLIMQPGFSTAKTISDISGRGVGLDVVKTSIEKLRGKIEIDSEKGKGSTFSIILPLTLAIIDGMLVKSVDETFIVPTLSVVESFVPEKEIVYMMKGRGELVNLRGEQIPVVRLNEALGLGGPRPEIWESTLVCVESERGRIAILVDALLGRQQVVIKTLGRSMAKIKEISGGAILGNGDIALIVNIDGLYTDSAFAPQ